MKSRFLFFIACIFMFSGCILPVPHRRLNRTGGTGRVLDCKTLKPVVGARVIPQTAQVRTAITDAKGIFLLEPLYGWHAAYCFGPNSFSLFPVLDHPDAIAEVTVQANGYKAMRFRFNPYRSSKKSAIPSRPPHVLGIEDLLLEKDKKPNKANAADA